MTSGPSDDMPRVVVPDLVGLPLFQARVLADAAGLVVSIFRQLAEGPAGHVVAQYPTGGKRMASTAPIKVLVSGVEQPLVRHGT